MIEQMIRIKPCKPEDVDLLAKVMAQDNHSPVAPTFIVEKGQSIVGSLGVVPSVLVWMDTQRTKVRDSLAVMNFYENVMLANGSQVIAVPCNEKSPYLPYMSEVGYVDVGSFRLFLKNLTI